MIEDIVWKVFRKSLSNGIYEWLRKSKLGRTYNYHSLSNFKEIYTHYQEQSLEVKDKVIIEVGSGFQFFTALFFLSNGASRVILVDPVFQGKEYKQLLELQFNEFSTNYNISRDFLNKIEVFPSMERLPVEFAGNVHCIYSHFVLEHLENLEEYFDKVYSLLSTGGFCFSYVDLSDHTYQLFDSRKSTKWLYRTRLIYHLRYSDSFFKLISDNRTWVNRFLFPHYMQLVSDKHFKIINTNLSKCKKTKIHKDVLKKVPYIKDDELYVSHFSLLIQK